MNKYLILFTIILGASCTQKCEQKNEHDTYVLENKSDKTIQMWIIENYPDTVIPLNYQASFYSKDIMEPNTSQLDLIKMPRGECIEDKYRDAKTHWLYIFDNDSLNTIPLHSIRISGRGVLERRAIDLDYLQSHNFTLTYEE